MRNSLGRMCLAAGLLTGVVNAYGAPASLVRIDFESGSIRTVPGRQEDGLWIDVPGKGEVGIPIQYEGGSAEDRYARIAPDPAGGPNHALQFWMSKAGVRGKSRGYDKGRIQLVLHDVNRPRIFARYRMYLHPDLAHIRSLPEEVGWFTLSEMFIGNMARPNAFRITLNLAKEKGVGSPLVLTLIGDEMTGGSPRNARWRTLWGEADRGFEVPLGQWLDVEVGYQQGNATSGRYLLRMRPAGGAWHTVFDLTRWTYHSSAPQPIPLWRWNPLKLYTSSRVLDHIRSQGGAAQVFWDDLDVLDDWPARDP